MRFVHGRYAVETAGAGGTLRARDLELDRPVALKLVGEEGLRFQARALANLSHPNVVAVYDVGRIEGQVFLAIELVDGPTLGEWAGSRRRSVRQLFAVFLDAARGLAAARAAGVLQPHFTQEHVRIGSDGRARVSFDACADGGSLGFFHALWVVTKTLCFATVSRR